MTGASDGSLAMWSQTKKRPTSVLRRAHGYPHPGLDPATERVTNSLNGLGAVAEESGLDSNAADAEPVGPGSVGGDAASWIGAVGVCKGTDLLVGYVTDTAALYCIACSRYACCTMHNEVLGL